MTIGFRPFSNALLVTNRVCGIGPSTASTSSRTESTIDRIRSTSPPKSACPGVSTILIRKFLHVSDVFLARIVMPRSRSRSLESMRRSPSSSPRCRAPAWDNSLSIRVVLPWSTWAIIAMLRSSVSVIGKEVGGWRSMDRGRKRRNYTQADI